MNKKIKVLVIEDEAFLLDMYKIKFEKEGYHVITAPLGKKGLELAKTKSPDIILLDVIMPQFDGFEVLAELKKDKKTKNIPVLILSNLGQKEEVQKGLDLGAIDFIIKTNLTPDEVVKKVEFFLKKH